MTFGRVLFFLLLPLVESLKLDLDLSLTCSGRGGVAEGAVPGGGESACAKTTRSAMRRIVTSWKAASLFHSMAGGEADSQAKPGEGEDQANAPDGGSTPPAGS